MSKNHVHGEIKLREIEEEILEVLYDLQNKREPTERIKMGEILDLLKVTQLEKEMDNKSGQIQTKETELVSKSQLTSIIRRKFEKEGYVDYLPYDGLYLTEEGYRLAKMAARKHRLAEALLGIIDLDWKLIHAHSCELEHGITPAIAKAIVKKLGSNPVTPYGTPIPSDDNKREKSLEDDYLNLKEAPSNSKLRLKRILRPQTHILLEKLDQVGIRKLNTDFYKDADKNETVVIKKAQISDKRVKIPTEEAKIILVEIVHQH